MTLQQFFRWYDHWVGTARLCPISMCGALTLLLLLAVPAHAQQYIGPDLQNALMQQLLQSAQIEPGAGPATPTTPNLGALANMPPEQQNALASQVQAIIHKNLTGAEQEKLTEFQSSPEGQAIIGKLPKMAQELAPVLMQAYLGQPIAPAAGPAQGNTPPANAPANPPAPVKTAPAFTPTQPRLPLSQPGSH